jgi:hypothetical protein
MKYVLGVGRLPILVFSVILLSPNLKEPLKIRSTCTVQARDSQLTAVPDRGHIVTCYLRSHGGVASSLPLLSLPASLPNTAAFFAAFRLTARRPLIHSPNNPEDP